MWVLYSQHIWCQAPVNFANWVGPTLVNLRACGLCGMCRILHDACSEVTVRVVGSLVEM